MAEVELEELKERQENEIAALRSIFDGSFHEAVIPIQQQP